MQDGQASFIYGPGGMLLEEVQTSDGSVNYYHQDRLGSVRALTNSAGSVVNTYEYDAYGQRTSQTGSVYNPFGYTGEYTDAESGLVYLRARYYDPSTQQFLTVDPLLASTEEAYAYVGGNPLSFTDPTGLWNNCSLWPNPFDPNSCVRLGFETPEGKWVVAGGVVAAGGVVVICFASGVCGAAVAVGAGAGAEGGGAALLKQTVEKAPQAEKTLQLIRAVKSAELADIQACNVFRNPANYAGDVKFFATTAEGATRFARQAYSQWPGEGPYTIVQTSIPTRYLTNPQMYGVVDRGISEVVLPGELLPFLSNPLIMPFMPFTR